jgi:hypothetical protein
MLSSTNFITHHPFPIEVIFVAFVPQCKYFTAQYPDWDAIQTLFKDRHLHVTAYRLAIS